MRLEPVIGLEIHVQLKTKSKMFCACSNRGEFEAPNTTVCPVCLGLPGTLPVINAQAVRHGLTVGLALGGTVTERSKFDRKNYFYPDLPKGYQISQYDLPIIAGGSIAAPMREDGETRTVKVGLTRIHLEEDAAKLHHAPDPGSRPGASAKSSLVDFNRAGTPLAEIVTEPDLRSPTEAKAFLQELRLIMRYLGVSDADMEKGHLRCDANISLREVPDDPEHENWPSTFNPKTEIKNINSFRAVERALEYEIKRQTKLWLDGKPVDRQSTRGWDDERGVTVEQRTKEDASDYRFFPEPDLPPLMLAELRKAVAAALPELPAARRVRFADEYGFNEDDARTLCDDKELSDYAEKVMSELYEWISTNALAGGKPATDAAERTELAKLAGGWLLSKLGGVMAERKIDIRTLKTTPEDFAELLGLIHGKKVTGPNALIILEQMVETGADPSVILKEGNLGQIEDLSELVLVAQNIVASNPKAVEDWKNGKTNAVQFLVGQMMKVTRGKAPPEEARRLVENELKKK